MLHKKSVCFLVVLLQGVSVCAEVYRDEAIDNFALGLSTIAGQKTKTPPPLPPRGKREQPTQVVPPIPPVFSEVPGKPSETKNLLNQIQQGAVLKKVAMKKPAELPKSEEMLIKLAAKKVTGAEGDEDEDISFTPTPQTTEAQQAMFSETLQELIDKRGSDNLKTAWKDLPSDIKKAYYDHQDLFDSFPGANQMIFDALKKSLAKTGLQETSTFNKKSISALIKNVQEDPDMYVGDGNTFLYYLGKNSQNQNIAEFKKMLSEPKHAGIWKRLQRHLKDKSGNSGKLLDLLSNDTQDHKSALYYLQQARMVPEETLEKDVKEISEKILINLEKLNTLEDLVSFLKDPDTYTTGEMKMKEAVDKLYSSFDTYDALQNKFLKLLQQKKNKELVRVLVAKPYLVDTLIGRNKALAYLTADDADQKGYIRKFINEADNDKKLSTFIPSLLEEKLRNDDFFEPSNKPNPEPSDDDDW